MKELIKISENNGKKAVSARELYDFLGLDPSQWSRWNQKNITNNKFAIKNEDFVELDTMSRSKDFALSIEFAKKLSMMARTDQGEKARQYFVECEKELVSNKMLLSEAQLILTAIQTMQVQQKTLNAHDEKLTAIESKLQQIETKQSIEIKQDYFTILAFCRIHNIQITFSEAIKKGKIAAKLSKEKGFDLRKTPDERYGYVNSYKESILKETFTL